MIGPAVLSLLSSLISPVTEVVKGKQAINKAVTEANIRKIEKDQISDIELDKIERECAGWKDDLSFAIFLLPAVLAFCPPALPHITAGFVALEAMPMWYQYALGMMLISVWGYRKLLGPLITSLAKTLLNRR